MNKLFGLFLLALALLSPSVANAATCFWVGGTGSINDVTHWSSGTGGAGSTCAAAGGWPNGGNGDSATFDAASGGGTITRNVSWDVGTLTLNAFTGTFGNSGDSAAVTVSSWANSGSGVRTVNLGASTWTCGRAASVACNWNQTGATNLTFNSNTATVVGAGSLSGGTQTFNLGNGYTYNALTLNADLNTNRGTTFNSGGTATITTFSVAAGNTISWNNTHAVTTLNFTGGTPSITALTTFMSGSFNNFAPITLTNATTCSYCQFRDMQINTSTITGTNFIDLGHNSGVSGIPPVIGGGGGGRIIGG